MSDIIYLVILIAIGLISTVIKAGKRKAEQTPRTDTEKGSEYSDPWEDIIREARMHEVLTPSVELEYNGRDEEVLDEEAQVELLKTRRIEEVKKRRTVTSDKYKSNVLNDNAPQDENAPLFEGFNVRDAVIYSEILKPKF